MSDQAFDNTVKYVGIVIGTLIVLGVAAVMYEGIVNGGFNRPW